MPHSLSSRTPGSRKPSPSSSLTQIPESTSLPGSHERTYQQQQLAVKREQRERGWEDPMRNFFVRKWLLFESTFALSMLEPWEKVLVLSLCIFLLALITTGVCNYLPFHLQFLDRRARFYILGDESAPLKELVTLLGERWF